jgi:hypothetical protein
VALTDRRGAPGISFALDENVDHGRIVLANAAFCCIEF